MPSFITGLMARHLSHNPLTLCVCCKVTRTDGAVFGFTNHNRSFFYNGVKYRAGSGMSPSAIENNAEMQEDNAEISWMFSDDQVARHDIEAGFFDNAKVNFFVFNYRNPLAGEIKGPAGNLGRTIISDNNTCSIEFTSLSEKTKQMIGDLSGETCRARLLGDEFCKFDLDGQTDDGYDCKYNGWVIGVSNRRSFITNLNNTFDTPQTLSTDYSFNSVHWGRNLGKDDANYRDVSVQSFDGERFYLVIDANIKKKPKIGDTGITHATRDSDNASVQFPFTVISVRHEPNDAYSFQVKSDFWTAAPSHTEGDLPKNFFANGILTFLSGPNANVEREVMIHDDQGFVMQEPFPFDISPDDAFRVIVGCNRTIEMCDFRFNNAINFVGEPDIKPFEQVSEIDKK